MPFDPDTPIFPADWALRAAQRGLAVFPVTAGAKSPPLITDWQNRATTNEDEALRFWNGRLDANPAVCPGLSGHGVLDIDVRDGKRGEQTIADIEKELQCKLPETYTVRTPSGGRHAYYSAPDMSSKNGVFDDPIRNRNGVDWKSRGGYVLAEGAHTEAGHYVVEVDNPIAPLPPVWAEYIKARLVGPAGSGASLDRAPACEPDLEENVAAAEKYFAGLIHYGQQAVQGSGGDEFTYRVGARLHELGVSPERGVELAAAWDKHNVPPWGPDDLLTKFQNAASYAQEPFGSKSPVASAQELSTLLPAPGCQNTTTLPLIGFDELIRRDLPPVAEIVPGLIEKGIPTFLGGPGGSCKSRLALQFGLCISAGRPIFDRPVVRCAFVFLSAEDGADEVGRRAKQICATLNITGLPPNAHLIDLKGKDCALVTMDEGGTYTARPFLQNLMAALRSIPGHKFVVLDSQYDFVAFKGKAKIDEGAVNAFVKQVLQKLCEDCDATLYVIAHPSRAGIERGDGGGWSVAFENAPRARHAIAPDEKREDAFLFKVTKRNHGPKGGPISLYWTTGALLPAEDMDIAAQEAHDRDACIRVAIKAAADNQPINGRDRIPECYLAQIAGYVSGRLTQNDVREHLSAAVQSGALTRMKSSRHRSAGFYPPEGARARGLAVEAKIAAGGGR